MTMATIPKPAKFVRTGEADLSLRTDDIEGARAKTSQIKTRDYTLNIRDIEGARPSSPFNPASKPIDVMRVRDIDGAQPRIYRNLPHSSRHTNPLNPEYELPSKVEPLPPEVKFIYDGINYDDIPGVHPRSYKTDKPPRDILKTSDIPGTSSRPRTGPYDRGNRNMDVHDINGDGKFRTRRVTNPLTPEYEYDGKVWKADFGIQHSNYLTRHDGIDATLTTSDIEGAKVTSYRQKYRRTRIPTETNDETALLMLPSMYKQTAELERQKAVNQVRGERIRRFESRHLRQKHKSKSPQNSRSRIQPQSDIIAL
jgi:hypothetical protein